MTPLLIVFCMTLIYGVCVLIAYKLSKVLFPKPKGERSQFERPNAR